MVKVLRGPDGEVLDVGRRTRTISPAIRRALEIRDQGCRWPGCHLRFTIGHHVESWADGGETKLSNLMLLCRYHHRTVHEGGWTAMYNEKDDTALFYGPDGVLRYSRREPARMGRRRRGTGRVRNGAEGAGGAEGPEGADVEGGPEAATGDADQLVSRNRTRGISPDGWTATSRFHAWGEDAWDLALRAMEALDREDGTLGQTKRMGGGTGGEEGLDQPQR